MPQPLLFIVAILLFLQPSIAQAGIHPGEDDFCGTIVNEDIKREIISDRDAGFYEVGQLYQGGVAGIGLQPAFPFYVPIVFHIFRRDDGYGGFDELLLPKAVQRLNEAYFPASVQFYLAGPVKYVNDSALYNPFQVHFNPVTLEEQTLSSIQKLHEIPNVLNVYILPGMSVNGVGTLTGMPFQGVFIKPSAMPPYSPYTLAHEIGHFFNLVHTFEELFGYEFVDCSNCLTAGDLICDTPASPGLNLGDNTVNENCEYIGEALDLQGEPYTPDTGNIMDYSHFRCSNHFTEQQCARILGTLLNSTKRCRLAHSPSLNPDTTAGSIERAMQEERREIAYSFDPDRDHNGFPDFSFGTNANQGFPMAGTACSTVKRVRQHPGPGEYSTIQAAVDASQNGDTILVADGVYSGSGNVNIEVRKRVVIRSENGPENCRIVLNYQGRAFFFDSYTGPTLNPLPHYLLEGFTIEGGYVKAEDGDFDSMNSGGAIFCKNVQPMKIYNCVFINNFSRYGGAIFVSAGSEVTIEACTFYQNGAEAFITPLSAQEYQQICVNPASVNVTHAGGDGGAIYFHMPSNGDPWKSPIRACSFFDNFSARGAAVFASNGVLLENCSFVKNWVRPAILWVNCGPLLFGMASSIPSGIGAGLYVNTNSYASKVDHCTFRENLISVTHPEGYVWYCANCSVTGAPIVPKGPGIGGGNLSRLFIQNSIFWDDRNYSFNTPYSAPLTGTVPEIGGSSSPASIRYNDIRGAGTSGTNIDADPKFGFGDANGNFPLFQFSLNAERARRAGELTSTSPCRNAGATSPNNINIIKSLPTDILGRPRQNRVDMGAYELRALYVTALSGSTEYQGDFNNIQDALDSAVDGDIVQLRLEFFQGKRNRNLDFAGKKIRLLGTPAFSPTYLSTIDCENEARAFNLLNAETWETVIQDIEVRNGKTSTDGGAVLCTSSPIIRNCRFRNCEAGNSGGAIFLTSSTAVIDSCEFYNNVANLGAGVATDDGTVSNSVFGSNVASRAGGGFWGGGKLANCIFRNNEVDTNPFELEDGVGGAVFVTNPLDVINCTFSGNDAPRADGIGLDESNLSGTLLNVLNSIFWDTSDEEILNVGSGGNAPISVRYSNVRGGFSGVGNINSDPLFLGTPNSFGYALSLTSPSRNSGAPARFSISEVNINDRGYYWRTEWGGPPPGSCLPWVDPPGRTDMGAIEGYGFAPWYWGSQWP